MDQENFLPQLYLIITEQFLINIPQEAWEDIFALESINCIRFAEDLNLKQDKIDILQKIAWSHNVATIETATQNRKFHKNIDGIHLDIAPIDTELMELREKYDTISLGINCNKSLHQAMVSGENDVDYVAFGDLFLIDNTDLPADEDCFHAVTAWATSMEIPCVIYGGIRENNFHTALSTQAEFIEISPSIWQEGANALAILQQLNKQCITHT